MQDPIRIFAISGSTEYQSAQQLQRFREQLERTGNYQFTVAEAGERGTAVPSLEKLADHDVLLVFCKRLELPADQLIPIMKWCWTGCPVVGIRTASHAFQTWPAFDSEILGGDYNGHGPRLPDVTRSIVAENAPHPVLAGVTQWTDHGKVYTNAHVVPGCEILLRTGSQAESQPLAWVRTVPASRGRVFYTSLGEAEDFAQPAFNRMLRNAIDWAACRSGGYQLRHFSEMASVKCPCGFSRRAFVSPENPLATAHMVDITEDSQSHYHRRLTEIYLIISGSGHMEINGEMIAVQPLDVLLIERGCRHRAIGNLRIVNIPIPSFDPSDEWFE
jgi:type 1 glutamine amidotransferase